MTYTKAACVAASIVALGASAGVQQPAPARLVVLQGVAVIDGTGAAGRPDMDVVLRGDRIQSIHPAGTQAIPADAEVRPLAGRFVIPGLIDSHIHLMQRFRTSRAAAYAELQRMLYGGVVLAREMAGDLRLTPEAARATLLGEADGPDLHYAAVVAGPHFFEEDPRPRAAARGLPAGRVPWAQAVTGETDLRLAVARAAGTHATGLKLYSQLTGDLLRRVTAEAHRQGLAVWAHATVYPSRPMEVVTAGVDAITHTCGLAWQARGLDPAQFERPNVNNRPRFDPTLVQADSAEMTALFQEMTRRGTLFEPTLAIHLKPSDDQFGCTTELVSALARAAHRAGVSMSAGTDFVAPDADAYPALHTELEALVDQDVLTPLEAITAATLNGARSVGLEATHGILAAGRVANVVVLEENPAQDIRNLRTVVSVIKRGRTYPRAAYRPGFGSEAQERK